MNVKLKEVFKGKVVNKGQNINTGVDEFQRYMLEYLIDNYCSEETFHEHMEKVVRRLKDTYDETEVHNKKIRPFKIKGFTPFQISVINLDEYIKKRAEFSKQEWISILINPCGLDPERKTTSGLLKLLYPEGKVPDGKLEEILLLSCERSSGGYHCIYGK